MQLVSGASQFQPFGSRASPYSLDGTTAAVHHGRVVAQESDRSLPDLLTVTAIALVAYAASNVLHEAVGHGGACVILGGKPNVLSSVHFECGEQASALARRGVAAGGTIVNFIAGAIALVAFRATNPVRKPHMSYFLWLFTTLNLLMGAGYFLFSGVGNIGGVRGRALLPYRESVGAVVGCAGRQRRSVHEAKQAAHDPCLYRRRSAVLRFGIVQSCGSHPHRDLCGSGVLWGRLWASLAHPIHARGVNATSRAGTSLWLGRRRMRRGGDLRRDSRIGHSFLA
jgi:hypothetical protein